MSRPWVAFEVETQVTVAKELGYIAPEVEGRVIAQVTEVARIFNGLLTSLGISSPETIQ